MKPALLVILLGLTAFTWAGGLEDPVPPVVKHIEIAGTLLITADGRLILKSNGHEFLLMLDADEPGVAALKSGMALIVKGTETIETNGTDQSRSLRPDEMIIRGRSYHYEDKPAS